MPFFEKFKNQLPGVTVPTANTTPLSNANTSNINTPRTATPPTNPRIRDSDSISTSSAYSRILPSRSTSSSTMASRDEPKQKRPPSPASESGSEYGLAYADSTDYEDDGEDAKSTKSKANAPPPLALTSSILRSGSLASTNHVRFPSNSDRSERSAIGITIPDSKPGHKRDTSVSSTSSAGSGDRSGKSNSALIAHALGLSQKSPSAYGRLGGPGAAMGGRSARSTSGSSSSGSRSAYSRGSNSAMKTGPGRMEREMETLLEDATAAAPTEEGRAGAGLSKSNSTGKQQRSVGAESGSETGSRSAGVKTAGGVGTKAHRSNTVQAPYSPETKTVKLPARARTSSERNVENGKEKKERVRKVRACMKCAKKIDDGRWVQTDGAGVLCEKCWKNMYLPKVRLVIFFEDMQADLVNSVADVHFLSRSKLFPRPMDSLKANTIESASIAIHATYVAHLSNQQPESLIYIIYRNLSPTSHFMCLTENPCAPTTTTKPTTRSAPPPAVASLSKARVRYPTPATATIRNT